MSEVPTSEAYKIEQFLKHILATLDTSYSPTSPQFNSPEAFQNWILPQLNSQSAIIINGSPYGSRSQFQEIWCNLPQTQHNLLSFDTHHVLSMPAQYVVVAHLKVRFDESGRTRKGDSSELINNNNASNVNKRPIYGPWFGVCLNLVVSEAILESFDVECISSFNWRITEKPENSIYNI
ncbi:hypothetical protein B5S32_g3328 [[Candida] boidinii]|nr:hypothetical protein B5S32_g3328 [[Candida] boidinii]